MKQLCSAVTLVAALLPYSAVMAGETMLSRGNYADIRSWWLSNARL